MRGLRLDRFAYCPVETGMGTFGKLMIPGSDFRCYTVEQDWEQNAWGLSCIPEGTYILDLDFYHHGGYAAYELRDVPKRSEIKMHVANVAGDVKGCIGLGDALGVSKGTWGVLNSKRTFAAFMAAMDGVDRTTITIASVFHVGVVGLLEGGKP